MFKVVPCRDLESNHDELVEDECREGDGDDVKEFVLKEDKRHDHDGSPCRRREPNMQRD